MKKVLIVIMLFTLISCEEKERFIHYTYNGVTVTRVDKGTLIKFYYGNYNAHKSLPPQSIAASYRGRDGYMEGYLVFKENKVVKIVRTGGMFEAIIPYDSLKLEEFDSNIKFIEWHDKFKGNYQNICWLSDSDKFEIQNNKENKSAVKAIYN
ncbi:MAG: hypothetical protein V4581_00180 [Bacteroidota bacterium]